MRKKIRKSKDIQIKKNTEKQIKKGKNKEKYGEGMEGQRERDSKEEITDKNA